MTRSIYLPNNNSIFSNFDDFFNQFIDAPVKYRLAENSNFPKLNIYSVNSDHGIKYVIEASIAGYNKEDIDVTVDRNKLTISYSKNVENKDIEDKNFFIQEMKSSSFSRSILLSDRLDIDNPITSYNNGILKIEFFEDKNKTPKRLTF